MKKELFYEKDNQLYIKKDFFPFLKKKKIRIGRGDERSFLIFPNENTFVNFYEEFEIPSECICAIRYYSNNKLFAYYDNEYDPNKIFRGEIVARNSGFLGGGIYCIEEEEYVSGGVGEENLRDYNLEFLKLEYPIREAVIIFQFKGSYYKCVHGRNRENIVKLNAICVKQDDFRMITEEVLSIVMEEDDLQL